MTDTASIFEAEAAAALARWCGHLKAGMAAADEAANALAKTDRAELVRSLEKLLELERMVAVRAELLGKRVAEGSP